MISIPPPFPLSYGCFTPAGLGSAVYSRPKTPKRWGKYSKGARDISAAYRVAQLWRKGREEEEEEGICGFRNQERASGAGSAKAAHVARRHDVVVTRAGAGAVLGDGRVKVSVPLTAVPVLKSHITEGTHKHVDVSCRPQDACFQAIQL